MKKLHIDAHLHIMRSAVNGIEDDRQRKDAETARFNVFSSLESDDSESALLWLDAYNAAIRSVQALMLDSPLLEAALRSSYALRCAVMEAA